MTPEKKSFINQIKEGQPLEDIFLVKEMNRAETRTGKPYLVLTLMDRTGEMGARLWDNVDAFIDLCPPGSLVMISGQAQAYRGTLQIKIDSLVTADAKDVDTGLFLQSSTRPQEEMAGEIVSLVKSVQDPFCRTLLQNFTKDKVFWMEFERAPAAKNMHHAYLGGLLEHTLAVAKLASLLADFYPGLDRDLLLTGALLHDIGKTRELAFDTFPFDYSDRGRLVGHLVLGVEMLREKINTVPDFPKDLATRLEHLILSHHGRYEFGSPALPMISEAFVLNFIDDLDAKLNFLDRLADQAPDEGYQWTDFQRTLERFLYIKGRPHAETANPAAPGTATGGDNESADSRQQSLF